MIINKIFNKGIWVWPLLALLLVQCKKEEFSIASTKLNDFVIAPFAGGTFGYKFAKKIFFHLVARYQFPMSNIYKDSPHTTKFNSVNFFVILGCRF